MKYEDNDVRELWIYKFVDNPGPEKVHTFKYADGMISHAKLLKVPTFYDESDDIKASDYLFWVKNGN